MKKIIAFLTVIVFTSCAVENREKLTTGVYQASLKVQDQQQLPFTFKVLNASLIEIYNAEEIIKVDEITYKNDSVIIQTPVFEGYIKAKISENELSGSFVKESYDRVVPFKAIKNANRFDQNTNAKHNITGNWETVFSENAATERYIAKGIFNQKGNTVSGTFRTTTGDYRYLEGVVDGDSLKLSTFDGAHAFLFLAKITDTTMVGDFYSGNHWKEPFTAKLNNEYELPSAENLTFLKEGFDRFDFSFPDKNGNLVALSDNRFKNKVTIVQIMGTWCPNCLDESKFLSTYYKQHKKEGLEVVALAFEVAKTKEIAFKGIDRLQQRIGIDYPVLLAQIGSEDKKLAHEKLPMLNHIISFPTTLFIDKNGVVRKIHTGFNGPATGQKYTTFKNEFETFVSQLLEE
jgi:thiol-disulfide isomerase/thioredoxin